MPPLTSESEQQQNICFDRKDCKLLQFYIAYSVQRASERLKSHRSSLFGRISNVKDSQDGKIVPALPALPKEN